MEGVLIMDKTKVCTKCNEEKNVLQFNKNKNSKDGRQYWCKSCNKSYFSKYVKREKEKNDNKTCNKCGKCKPIEGFAIDKGKKDGHRNACKSCESKRVSKYYRKNSEKVKEYQRGFYENNREKVLKANSVWRANNQDFVESYNRIYYQENKEKIKNRTKLYIRTPKGRLVDRLAGQRREARKKKLINTLTISDWKLAKKHLIIVVHTVVKMKSCNKTT